ncbi:hypothetical protein [Tateyamaria omphalii]|uniref:Lipoprotein n=1 Tax=Tateyamaria omphalii TaxID=299262 RepID=A0A1P8MXP8_9RHOB|nr:hypothetical protein [Tateyamaria omphalii]APX12803.1 hypothetical protein BWR18_14745 [Tateyamaria omphalii]
MLRLLSLMLLLAPLPALALSCVPYGVTNAYQEAVQAEDGYVPVLGTLDFDADLLPDTDPSVQVVPTDPVTSIPATFKGEALAVRGVDRPFETDVVLEVECIGPWCPQIQPGPVLGFLRQTTHSYALRTDACGGFLFGRPSEAQVDQLRDCLAGRDCVPMGLR